MRAWETPNTCPHLVSFLFFILAILVSAMVWMFVSPQNSYVETESPSVMVFRGGAFRRWLGHEGRVLMNGISALIKEAPEILFFSSVMWGYSWKAQSMDQKVGPHRTPNLCLHCGTSQPPELWEKHLCGLLATQSMVFCYSSPNRLRLNA